MTQLFVLYQWTFIAGCTAGPALSLLGGQLATRDRAMQTLCVGQGAMVGVLLALGFLPHLEEVGLATVVPFLSALVVSALTYLVTDRLVEKRLASRNTTFAFVFAVLLACGQLIGALFPALESHMAQIYFGDLATLTILDSKVTVVASLLSLGVLLFFRHSIGNQSFECAIFGDALAARRGLKGMIGFKLLTLVMLCFSVQFLGFLFTIAMLFLPTGLLSLSRRKGLGLHSLLCVGLAAVTAASGFLLSLSYTRLPTVPTIVVLMVGGALSILALESILGLGLEEKRKAVSPQVLSPQSMAE